MVKRTIHLDSPSNHAATGTATTGDVLNDLAIHDVVLLGPAELRTYLEMHAGLSALLLPICKKARAAFGPGTELALELYRDPETGDSYPTLYVRQEAYESDIIDRIDTVCAEFHGQLEAAPGYLLITTDFRRPRGSHVV